MSVTLYKATDDLVELLAQIDPETGELPEELGHARDLVASRAAAVAAVIANRELEAQAMADRLKEITKRVQAEVKRTEYLRSYLLVHMQKAGITEIESADKLLKIKRYPERDKSVDVFDSKQIPAGFVTKPLPPEPAPDKTAIRKALDAGQDVPGARIVAKDRLVIG